MSYGVLMKKEAFYDDDEGGGVDPMIGIFLHLNFDAHSIVISLLDEYDDDDEAMVIVNNDVTSMTMLLKAY